VIIIGARKRETRILVHVLGQVRMQASMVQRRAGYHTLGYRKDHRTAAFQQKTKAPRHLYDTLAKLISSISMGWG